MAAAVSLWLCRASTVKHWRTGNSPSASISSLPTVIWLTFLFFISFSWTLLLAHGYTMKQCWLTSCWQVCPPSTVHLILFPSQKSSDLSLLRPLILPICCTLSPSILAPPRSLIVAGLISSSPKSSHSFSFWLRQKSALVSVTVITRKLPDDKLTRLHDQLFDNQLPINTHHASPWIATTTNCDRARTSIRCQDHESSCSGQHSSIWTSSRIPYRV